MEANKSQGRTIGKFYSVASTVLVEIEGKDYAVAETFSPVARHLGRNRRLEANANAAHIVKCVNNFDELVSIAQTVKFWYDNENNYPEGTQGYNLAKKAKAVLDNLK